MASDFAKFDMITSYYCLFIFILSKVDIIYYEGSKLLIRSEIQIVV